MPTSRYGCLDLTLPVFPRKILRNKERGVFSSSGPRLIPEFHGAADVSLLDISNE